MPKCSILVILSIIMKELGIVDSRQYKAVNLPVSIRDSLLGWMDPNRGLCFRTVEASVAAK